MRHLQILALLLVSATAGCTVRTRGTAAVAYVPAQVSMVAVGPDVWVVEDSPDPIFYSRDGYYTIRDGYWYRSPDPYRGWVIVDAYRVPGHIRAINQPDYYRRWKAPPNARRIVRDHRQPKAYR